MHTRSLVQFMGFGCDLDMCSILCLQYICLGLFSWRASYHPLPFKYSEYHILKCFLQPSLPLHCKLESLIGQWFIHWYEYMTRQSLILNSSKPIRLRFYTVYLNYAGVTIIVSWVAFPLCWRSNNSALVSIQFTELSTVSIKCTGVQWNCSV